MNENKANYNIMKYQLTWMAWKILPLQSGSCDPWLSS